MSSFPLRPVSAGSGRKEFIDSMFRRGYIFRGTQSFPRTRRRPDRAAKHHITRGQISRAARQGPAGFGVEAKWTGHFKNVARSPGPRPSLGPLCGHVSRQVLHVDDIVLVRPGTRIPGDGVVVEGTAEAAESMMTGESKPLPKAPGATVIAENRPLRHHAPGCHCPRFFFSHASPRPVWVPSQ